MRKTTIKLSISFALLINTMILVFFFNEYVYLLDDFLIPILFVYFLWDAITVIIPKLNRDLFSKKYIKRFFKEYPEYNIQKVKQLQQKENKIALLIFVLYFSGITGIGLLYLKNDWFELKYLYLVFLFINLSDYICIMLWCPFRDLFLKNKCCNTCRISNWDRLMKFALLLFIPNIFTISIFIIGLIVFLSWEISYTMNPQFFFSLSNEALRCSNCDLPCNLNTKKEQS
jgi:hypothetical protein